MLQRLARWSVRHRRTVLAGWLLVSMLGMLSMLHIGKVLTAVTDVPGSPSAAAVAALREAFDENLTGNFVVITPFGDIDAEDIEELKTRVTRAAEMIPSAVVLHQQALGGSLYSSIGTGLDLIDASAQTLPLRAALDSVGLHDAMVTGPPALEHDVRPVLADDLRRGGVVGLLMAVLVLFAALGRWRSAVVPLLNAVVTVLAAMTVVYVLAIALRAVDVPMVLYVPNIVELVGLGLAMDYGLLVVHRHRELVALGIDDPIAATMQSAGKTVWWAGSTAAIGLAALWLVPIPLVRSLGIAGFVVPIVALLVTFTLIPTLLSSRLTPAGLLASRSPRFWEAVARKVLARPGRAMVLSLLLCAALASPLLGARFAPASLTALPSDVPASVAVGAMAKKLGPGVITPHEVLIDVGPRGGATNAVNDAARISLVNRIGDLPEVFAIFSDTTTAYIAEDRYQRIFVIGRHDFAASQTAALVRELRALTAADVGYAGDARIYVGGAPAQGTDFLERLRQVMPWILVLVLVLAFFALRRVFGSVRIAGLSIVMNLASLAAACGVVVAVFQYGWGSSLLRTYHVPQIESWTFVFMFALLFGLTMDYQVFVVRSMRESGLDGEDRLHAIQEGLMRSGGIVTAAALAFVSALSGLMFGRIAGLQELGYGLAAGVLIDATIVRGVMLPSALALFGRK